MKTKKSFFSKYLIINLIILITIIGMLLISFSITNDGSLNFLYAINPENKIAFLSIGLGVIACIIVAIALNLSGEASQSLTRNILASPFTLGLTPVMSLSYLISSFFIGFPIWGIGLMTLGIIFLINMLPTYLISISKYKYNQNLPILYGLSISILLSSLITLISFFTKNQHYNVLGWMVIEVVTFSNEKLIYGSIFLLIGMIILLFNIKKLHIIEHTYFKATTLNIHVPFLNLTTLFAISLMCVGGFIAYAPFTLLGFAIPYISKRFLIQNYDIRWSIIPSTLLSILITLIAYTINCYLQSYIDVIMILLMLPFVILMMCQKKMNYV